MIRFRTLGSVELRTEEGVPIESLLAQTKRLGLLAYLSVAAPGGFVRRDTLLAMFWPEMDDDRGRGALNQALYYLRRELGPDVVRNRGRAAVGVDPDHLRCDAGDLLGILGAGGREAMRTAVEGFRGPFLPGFHLADAPDFMDWLDRTRRGIDHRVAAAAWELAEIAEEEGRPSRALELGRMTLELNPSGEDRLRAYLEMCLRAGELAGAVETFDRFARRMHRDYDLGVSPQTLELVDRIRESVGRPERAAEADHAPPSAGVMDDGDPGGPTEIVTGAEPSAPHEGGAGAWARSSPWRLPRLLLPALGLIVTVAAAVWWTGVSRDARRSDEGSVTQRVAVLPFINLSPVEGDEFLAEGLALEVVSRLSRIRGLEVLPMSSTRAARRSDADAAALGDALGARWLVEGSLRRREGTLRITIQLVDAPGDRTVWSEEYDLGGGRLRQFETRVTEEVARALQLETREGADRRLLVQAGDEEVYRGYLRARALLGRLDSTSLADSREQFMQVLVRDSTFAPAWSGLAAAYLQMTANGGLDPVEGADLAYRAARRALQLDPELAEAYAALAVVQSNVLWDAEAAERNFRVALGLDPSSTQALRGYANHLRNLGRFEEALALIGRVRELEPTSSLPTLEEGIVQYLQGDWDAAGELARRLLREDPRAVRARTLLALTEVAAGRYREAAERLDPRRLGTRRSDNEALRARALALAGDTETAREILAWVGANAPEGNGAFHQAVIFTALGEKGRAVQHLERAADARSWLVRLIGVEPTFVPLRSDAGFLALRARLGV